MKRYTMEQKEGWTLYRNQGGAEIGAADCPVLELDGFIFKDPEGTGELQPAADAIVVDFGVQEEAILELLTGRAAPAGRPPIQLPADMETVEVHWEDKPLDLKAYTDEMASTYDYGFGLTY